MSPNLPLLALIVVSTSSAALANETEIIRASLSWDSNIKLDVIKLTTGFKDNVPNLGKIEYAEAVQMTRFCYIGSADEVCSQVLAEIEARSRDLEADEHQGLTSGKCSVEAEEDNNEKVAVASYVIVDDYAGSFEVTRTIRACGR